MNSTFAEAILASYQCHCGKWFTTKSKLEEHRRNVHQMDVKIRNGRNERKLFRLS